MATTPVPEAAARAHSRFVRASMAEPTEYVLHPATFARFRRDEVELAQYAGPGMTELLGLPLAIDPAVGERIVRVRARTEIVADDGFTRIEEFHIDQEIGPWG